MLSDSFDERVQRDKKERHRDSISAALSLSPSPSTRRAAARNTAPLTSTVSTGNPSTSPLRFMGHSADFEINLPRAHKAASDGKLGVLGLALDAGMDVNTLDCQGYTPLHHACMHGHCMVAAMLLAAGAHIDATGGIHNGTPIHHAIERGHDEVVELLVKRLARLDVAASDGTTPLHNACAHGRQETTALLLKRGVGVGTADSDGRQALQCACAHGHGLIAALVLEHGADLFAADNSGVTALMNACEGGHSLVVLLLLERSVRILTDKDTGGRTPLHWACEEGHHGTITILLEYGADAAALTKSGETPLQRACANGHGDANAGNIMRTWEAALAHGEAAVSALPSPKECTTRQQMSRATGVRTAALGFAVRGGHMASARCLLRGRLGVGTDLQDLQGLDLRGIGLASEGALAGWARLGDLLVAEEASLHVLDVSSCDMQYENAAAILRLSTLRQLDMHGNDGLGWLPDEIGTQAGCPELVKLDVSHCGLVALPHSMVALKNLQTLDLSGNPELGGLSPLVGKLHGLKTLRASNCGFSTDPTPSLAEAPPAAWNHVAYNCVSKCLVRVDHKMNSESVGWIEPGAHMMGIGWATLEDGVNRLCTPKGWVSVLSSSGVMLMERISRPGGSLPTAQGLCALETLVISGNAALTALPAALRGLQRLKHLDASYCSISTLPDTLGKARSLQVLDVSGNAPMKTLPDEMPAWFCGLVCLDASACDLKHLPSWLGALPRLETLDVSQNIRLTELPMGLSVSPKLTTIGLDGCDGLDPLLLKVNKGAGARYLLAGYLTFDDDGPRFLNAGWGGSKNEPTLPRE